MIPVPRAGSSKAGSRGSGCLVVFGAIFMLAGLAAGAFAVASIWQWAQARNWQPVPATLLETDLRHGDDTFEVTARYRYRYGSVEHEGTRVSFHPGSDNIGDFHEATHDRLQQHLRDARPVTVYVNPENPSEAVIVRDLRWGLIGFLMIFPLVFGGTGAGIVAFALAGKRSAVQQQERRTRYPGEPWRWRPGWESGVIRADTRRTLWFAGFFAMVWNLISLPLPFMLRGEVLDKGNYAALIGLLFPAIGIGLIVWFIRLVMQQRRFGSVELTLDTFPGAPGRQLAGKLHVPARLPVDSLLHVTLTCVRRRTTGSGKNRSTHEDFLWQDEQRLRVQHHHVLDGTRMHIAFPLPADRPPTDDSDADDTILWRLDLAADVPGVDFGTSLEVPVFATGAAPPAPGRSVASDAAEAPDWRRTGVVAREYAEGLELFFPPARHKGMALMLTLTAAVFSGVTWFLAGRSELFMAFVFGGFSLLLVSLTMHSWLHRSRLMLKPGVLRVQRGRAWWNRPRELPAQEIRQIGLETTTRAGSTQYYDIAAVTREGRRVKLAATLPGRRDAQSLADLIAARTGVVQGDQAGRGKDSQRTAMR